MTIFLESLRGPRERIIEACRVRILTDLSASRVQKFLADLRADGRGIQTSNHYLCAI